jgi:hypothetical protein
MRAAQVGLRLTGSAVLRRKPGVEKCRMIQCAKDGGRSGARTRCRLKLSLVA